MGDHSGDPTLFLNSRCHTGFGTEVSYDKRTGVLTIACKKCKALIVQIAVHHAVPDPTRN